MCDEFTEKDINKIILNGRKMSRRDFTKMGTTALMATTLPKISFAETVIESAVEVSTPDGVSDCYFVHPASGNHPGILMWPDIKGLRAVYKAIAKRLAESGYTVLLVNPYYRDATAPVLGPEVSFGDPETMELLWDMAEKLTQKAVISDAKAFIRFLDDQLSVDQDRKIGTFGYCMAGELVVLTAASVPNRVGAVASFHGSRSIVTDGSDSPHLFISKSSAHAFHAVAENDDQRSPETRNIIIAAYNDAGLPAEIEVYAGTLHGWCTPDFQGYDEKQSERAWGRLLHLFSSSLKE